MVPDTLVIAEANPNDGAAANEFIVLYNPTPDTITLPSSFRLRWTNGTSRSLNNAYTLDVAPFGFYKVARPISTSDSDAYFGTATGEATLTSASAAISWDGTNWYDKVAWGTYTGADSEPPINTASLTSGNSVVRNPDTYQRGGGSIDSNTNSFDFSYNVAKVSKNRTSPPERIVFHVSGPSSITLGTPFTLYCTAVVRANNTTYNDSVVTSYTGAKAWANLSVSSGSISPDTTGAAAGFTNGTRSLSVTVTAASDPVTITASDGYCTGFVTINLASTAIPNEPTRLRPPNGNDTDTLKPQFSWLHNDTTSSPQAKYHIQFSTASNFSSVLFEETVATSNTAPTLSGSLPSGIDSTLYWRVRTSNSGDNFSPFSSGDSTFNARLRVPSAPTLTAPADNHETTRRSIRLAWTHSDSDGSSQDSFTIQISKIGDFSTIWAQDTASTSNQFYDTTFPTVEDTYYWRVATRDKIGFGAFSDSRKIQQLMPVVLISEVGVSYNGSSTDSIFVELFVKDDRDTGQDVDLTGWQIYTTTTGAATLRKTFGSLTVKESSFVTLYFDAAGKTDETTDGSDSRALIYTSSTNGSLMTSQGLVQLLSSAASDTRDIVVYSDQSSLNAAIDAQLTRLVTAGEWSPDAVASNTVSNAGMNSAGNSIRRSGGFVDGNVKGDWSLDSQTPGNHPISSFTVTSDSTNPYSNGDSFTLTIKAYDALNREIIGARFRPTITVSSGTITPTTVRFTADHSDFNSYDTTIRVGIIGVSGTCTITITANGKTAETTVNMTTTHDKFVLGAPLQVKRSSNFSLRVRATDAGGATFTTFTGTVSLTVSKGTISPTSISMVTGELGDTTFPAQLSGVGLVTVTATGNSKTGTVDIVPLTDTAFIITEFVANDTGITGGSADRDEFVEIKNIGGASTAISGYKLVIAPQTANDTYTFPTLSVPAGKYVVVHFNKTGVDDLNFNDTDGAAHLYGINSSPAMADYDDAIPHSSVPYALSLYASSTQNETTIVDFVGVDGGATSDVNLKDGDAVAAGIWTNDATLNQPTTASAHEARSFYRVNDTVDSNTNGSSEWSAPVSDGSTETFRWTEGWETPNTEPSGTVTITLSTTSSPNGDTFVAGDTLLITLTAGVDGDATRRNSTNVRVYSDTDPVGIVVTLIETGVNSKVFRNEAYAASGSPLESNDGMRVIKTEPGNTLTIEWLDSPAIKTSTAQTGPLDHFKLTPAATTINQGDQLDLKITAQDMGNFTVTTFTGTVSITASDSIVYPSTWTFASADNGETTAKIRFGAGAGVITCTVTSGSKTGTTTIEILADTNYLINEVCPEPSVVDWNGDGTASTSSDEWVELFNKSTTSMSLTGYGLRPQGSANQITLQGSIPSKGYVTVYRGTSDAGKSYHYDSMGVLVDTKTALRGAFSVSLPNGGGTVELLRASDSAVIAAVTYADVASDSTYFRGPDGINAWYAFKKASPGTQPITSDYYRVSSANATFNVDAPASVTVENAFTLRTALLARSGDTLNLYSDTAKIRVVGAAASINVTELTFAAGVSSQSVTFTAGNTNETAGLYVELQGNVMGYDSVLLIAPSTSRETSQVNVEQAIADGIDTATVQVIVLTAAGAPLNDSTVTITSSKGSADTISPASVQTDVNGVATFTVKSSSVTPSKITVVAGGITLWDSPTIYWLDPTETGVNTTFGTEVTLMSIDDDSHSILFPVWRHDGKALAFLAKTAGAQDTWNVYVVYDDGAHTDGAANDGVFSDSYRLTGSQQNVFQGSKIAWADILKADGTRCATGEAGDGVYDVIYSGNNGSNTRDLYAVRAEGQDNALAQSSTVRLTDGGGNWTMPVSTPDTDAMYAIFQGSIYRIYGKGTTLNGSGNLSGKILDAGTQSDFMIGGLPWAVVDLAMYDKNVIAASLILNKNGNSVKNKRSEILLLNLVDVAGYRQYQTTSANCVRVNRADSMVAWNLSWDTGRGALSWARDVSGNFNWLKLWTRPTAPEQVYLDSDFDVEAIYVTSALATPNRPVSIISNKKGLNDLSATFSQGAIARVAYASYDTTFGHVRLKIADIDGVTVVNQDGGLLFENGRLTAVVDQNDVLSGSIEIKVAKPTAAPSNPTPESIALTGNAREFFPNGTTFNDSITVTIYYDTADLTAAGVTDGTAGEYTLRIYWYDPVSTSWVDYHAVVDPINRNGALGSLTFQTKHFSIYGVGVQVEHPTRPDPIAPAQGAAVTGPTTFSWRHHDPQDRVQRAFRLEISGDSAFSSVLVTEERTMPETAVLITPPVGDSTLYWRVRTGALADAFGPWSTESSFVTSIHLPTAPTLLSPADNTETQVNTPIVSWIHNDPDSSPQISFRVEFARDTSFETVVVHLGDTPSSAAFPTALDEGVWFWRLATSDAAGQGAWSASRKLTVWRRPAGPAVVGPIRTTVPDPRFSWTHRDPYNLPQSAYRIRLALDSALTSPFLDMSAAASETSVRLTGETMILLRGNRTVYFGIRTSSDTVTFGAETIDSFIAVLNPPVAPTLIEPIGGAYQNNFVHRWTHNDAEGDSQIGYDISIARDSAFQNVVFNVAAFSTADSKIIQGLSGGTYYWRMATRDSVDLGQWSLPQNFLADTRAGTPALISPISNEVIGTPEPTFRWGHNDGGREQSAALLEISRSPSFQTIWVARTITGNAQTAALTGTDSLFVESETTVYWRVRTASVGTDFGAPSRESSFLLSPKRPDTPALTSPVPGFFTREAEILFEWAHNSQGGLSQAGYEIEFGSTPSFEDATRFRGTTDRRLLHAPSDFRKQYWRVRTSDVMGQSPWSEPRFFNAPIWDSASILTDKRIPASETVTMSVRFVNDSAPTERTGGARITIGERDFGAGVAAADTTITSLSFRIDTPGIYPIIITEDTRVSRDTLYVLARSLESDTYIVASGRDGMGLRLTPSDTRVEIMLRVIAPDTTVRMRIVTLGDSIIVAPTAPHSYDSTFARWSLPISTTAGRKICLIASRNGETLAIEIARVFSDPTIAGAFMESETAAQSISIEMPANAFSRPLWIDFRRTVADSAIEGAKNDARRRGRKLLDGTALEIVAEDLDGNAVEAFNADLRMRMPTAGGHAVKIAFLDNDQWVEINGTTYDSTTGEAIAEANHLSVWGLTVGFPGTGSVQQTRVYPNPWRIDGQTGSLATSNAGYGVKFDQLPTGTVRFRIYTLVGELVLDGSLDPSSLGATAANGNLQVVDVGGATGQVTRWNLKNQSGRDVASGIYLILLDGPGGTASRKVAIIR